MLTHKKKKTTTNEPKTENCRENAEPHSTCAYHKNKASHFSSIAGLTVFSFHIYDAKQTKTMPAREHSMHPHIDVNRPAKLRYVCVCVSVSFGARDDIVIRIT